MQLPQEQVQRIFRKIVPERALEGDNAVLSSPTYDVCVGGLRDVGARSTQDKTGDGNLDKMEFWRFIETIGGRGSFPPVRPSVLCVHACVRACVRVCVYIYECVRVCVCTP